MEMDNFDYPNSSLSLFLFCNEPSKKNFDVSTVKVEPPPPPIRSSTLLAGPPSPLQAYVLYG